MLEHALLRARLGEAQLPHVLLIGGSAQSRAAISATICKQLGLLFTEISCAQLRTGGHLAARLMESSENIFFMDCIEKLPLKLQKILSVAMKEHYVPIVIEEWGILRDAEVDLHPFTMIAGLEDEILLPSRLTFGFPVRLHLF